jgi:hypothetical protein
MIAFGLLLPARVQGQGQAPPSESDTIPANVVQRGLAAFNRHDINALMAIYDSAAYTHETLGDSTGLQRVSLSVVRAAATRLFAQAPDAKVASVRRLSYGPFVVDLYETVANGKTSQHLDIFEVRNGKVVREWEY